MKVYDVVIVGGSYSGLSAALQLVRARRSVLIVDSSKRRNRFADKAYGFIGFDGVNPGKIAEQCKEDLIKYESLSWIDTEVTRIERNDSLFEVEFGSQLAQSRKIILASGVRDKLPQIDGLQDRWGKSVFHCPYCHGFELDRGNIGVIAVSDMSIHQALIVSEWGQVTLLTNGTLELTDEQKKQLFARKIVVNDSLIASVEDEASILTQDAQSLVFDGLFVAPLSIVNLPQMGFQSDFLKKGPFGEYIEVNDTLETCVSGIFSCGNTVNPAASVAIAVGDGVKAGTAVHKSLIFG